MSGAPTGALELLERALSYTLGALVRVRPSDLNRPTPCAGWSLDTLLWHMDDALDAFADGAAGSVSPEPAPRAAPLGSRVERLQDKACGLLGAWAAVPTGGTTVVGGLEVPAEVVAAAAALEITTHGWDVVRSLDLPHAVPEDLAAHLLALAPALVAPEDRGTRFAVPEPIPRGASAERRLLALLGRDPGRTGPLRTVSTERRTGRRRAS